MGLSCSFDGRDLLLLELNKIKNKLKIPYTTQKKLINSGTLSSIIYLPGKSAERKRIASGQGANREKTSVRVWPDTCVVLGAVMCPHRSVLPRGAQCEVMNALGLCRPRHSP